MNPFDDPAVAERYEQWYSGHGRRADRLEKRLLAQLLEDFPGASTVLDVGCGTGHFTRWMASRGLSARCAETGKTGEKNAVKYMQRS